MTFKKYKLINGTHKYRGLIEGETEKEVLDRLRKEEPDSEYVLERI